MNPFSMPAAPARALEDDILEAGAESVAAQVVGTIALIFAVAMILNAIPQTMREIVKEKTTKLYDIMPYLAMCVMHGNWVIYFGLARPLLVQPVIANVVGVLVNFCYVCIMFNYAADDERRRNFAKKAVVLFVPNAIAIGAFFAGSAAADAAFVRGLVREESIGGVPIAAFLYTFQFYAVAVTAATFAAPLGVVARVIRTRSVDGMPPLLSLTIFLQSAAWIVYGSLTGEYVAIVSPNAFGAPLGLAQLVIFFAVARIERRRKGDIAAADSSGRTEAQSSPAAVSVSTSDAV